eukprot:5460678-Alexandrium_andersonii.AAC.1
MARRSSSGSQPRQARSPNIAVSIYKSNSPPPGRPISSPSQGTRTPLHTRKELARARIITP